MNAVFRFFIVCLVLASLSGSLLVAGDFDLWKYLKENLPNENKADSPPAFKDLVRRYGMFKGMLLNRGITDDREISRLFYRSSLWSEWLDNLNPEEKTVYRDGANTANRMRYQQLSSEEKEIRYQKYRDYVKNHPEAVENYRERNLLKDRIETILSRQYPPEIDQLLNRETVRREIERVGIAISDLEGILKLLKEKTDNIRILDEKGEILRAEISKRLNDPQYKLSEVEKASLKLYWGLTPEGVAYTYEGVGLKLGFKRQAADQAEKMGREKLGFSGTAASQREAKLRAKIFGLIRDNLPDELVEPTRESVAGEKFDSLWEIYKKLRVEVENLRGGKLGGPKPLMAK